MRLKKFIFDIKDRLNGYEYTYDFIESLRDRCDWGIVDKTSEVYQDVFESKPEVFDLIDLFDSIEDEIEEYEGDEYQAYHDYIAGVVDYYDLLDGEEIVFEQNITIFDDMMEEIDKGDYLDFPKMKKLFSRSDKIAAFIKNTSKR